MRLNPCGVGLVNGSDLVFRYRMPAAGKLTINWVLNLDSLRGMMSSGVLMLTTGTVHVMQAQNDAASCWFSSKMTLTGTTGKFFSIWACPSSLSSQLSVSSFVQCPGIVIWESPPLLRHV